MYSCVRKALIKYGRPLFPRRAVYERVDNLMGIFYSAVSFSWGAGWGGGGGGGALDWSPAPFALL